MHDKKFKEGKMVFIVPTEIGKVIDTHTICPADLIRESRGIFEARRISRMFVRGIRGANTVEA